MSKRINLLPDEYREHINIQVDPILVGSAALLLLIIVVITVLNTLSIKDLEKEKAILVAKNQQLQKTISSFKISQEGEKAAQARANMIRSINGKKLTWSNIFKELSLLIPNQTWLTQFQAANSGGDLSFAIDGEALSQERMAQFFSSLEMSYYFKDVLLELSQSMEDFEPSVYQFRFANASGKAAFPISLPKPEKENAIKTLPGGKK